MKKSGVKSAQSYVEISPNFHFAYSLFHLDLYLMTNLNLLAKKKNL